MGAQIYLEGPLHALSYASENLLHQTSLDVFDYRAAISHIASAKRNQKQFAQPPSSTSILSLTLCKPVYKHAHNMHTHAHTHVLLCACAIVSQTRRRKPSTWSDTMSSILVVDGVSARCLCVRV